MGSPAEIESDFFVKWFHYYILFWSVQFFVLHTWAAQRKSRRISSSVLAWPLTYEGGATPHSTTESRTKSEKEAEYSRKRDLLYEPHHTPPVSRVKKSKKRPSIAANDNYNTRKRVFLAQNTCMYACMYVYTYIRVCIHVIRMYTYIQSYLSGGPCRIGLRMYVIRIY